MRRVPRWLLVLLAMGVGSSSTTSLVHAQGTLSGLGFGYPVGGVSTRAAATGGALGEFDAVSPRNPASLGGLRRTLLAAQTEPEFRTVRLGNLTEKTTSERVPLLLVAFPAAHGVGVAFSGTTLLDRSFSTSTQNTVLIGGVPLQTNDRSDVRGSIADLRAGLGWRVNERLSVGVAGHLFTGDNLAVLERQFADTTAFGSVLDTSRATFFGKGASVGAQVQLLKGLAAGLSYRAGGTIESRVRDTVRSRANVPNRLGAALQYSGIAGSQFAISVEQQDWSRMAGLGSSLVEAHDVTNWSAGGEVTGPQLLGATVLLRAGYAHNTLPFGIGGRMVRESRITGGFGLPVAHDFASLDFSVQRALRSLNGSSGRESAWLLGVGVQIRPNGP